MKLNLKKEYDFESNCIEFLIEKISFLFSKNDTRIKNNENRELMTFLLRKIALKGFIRTHSFIVNWLREFFETGVLTSKTFHEITDELPWSWDQTKRYFDSLEENSLILYSRNSKGQKVCQLKLTGDSNEQDISQNQRLFENLKFRKRIPIKSLPEIHQVYKKYCEKFILLNKINQKKENSKRNIRCARKKEMDHFIHEIVQAYFNTDGIEEENPIYRIEMVLKNKPIQHYSLVWEDE